VDTQVTCSNASERGLGIWSCQGLSPHGCAMAMVVLSPVTIPIGILFISLFDKIGAARRSFEVLVCPGIYIAAEIDDVVELPDVTASDREVVVSCGL
jgi:hypothetical protein